MLEKILSEMPRAENPYSRALESRFKELKESSFLTEVATFDDFIKEIKIEGSALNPIGSKTVLAVWVKFEGVWKEATQDQCQLLAEQGYRPVPEWMGIIHKIKTLRADWTEYVSKPPCIYLSEEAFIAKELHRWLLEGE